MIDFAQWLSNSFGTGQLAPDSAITVATVSIVFLTITLMARVSLGTKLEDFAGNDSAGMHESLDQLQIELRTVSQLLLYSLERSRLRARRLRVVREASLDTLQQDGAHSL
jgi:hypothetical protein